MSDPTSAAEGSMSERKRVKRDAVEILIQAAKGQGVGATSETNRTNAARKLISRGWVTQQDLDTLPVDEIMHRVDELIPN
ncbi:MAG: hypothetical protein ACR2OO_10425 [Thermomicrobiales bacterium]